jgi:putative methionine-R-sulfoxide reductase with GAF domain
MSNTDFHGAFNEIMAQLKEKLGISNAIIRKLENDELKTAAYFGYGREEALLRIFLGQGVSGRCAEDKTTVVINDLSRYNGQYIAGIDNAQAELCIPMMIAGKVIGTFNIESTYKDNFTPEKVEFISRMAKMLVHNLASIENKAGLRLARALANLESF